jgi:hypothetical protein
MIEVIERGWIEDSYESEYCLFRRNTLIQEIDVNIGIIVYTFGARFNASGRKFIPIGVNRHYETSVLVTRNNEDIKMELYPLCRTLEINETNHLSADKLANEMHKEVVNQMLDEMEDGRFYYFIHEELYGKGFFEKEDEND